MLKMPGRPKLRSDDAQREIIIRGARDLFVEAGYVATTTDAVAARCGISKRTLYRLFPTKTDLFRAMVVQHRGTMLALPRADDDATLDQALAEIFRLHVDEAEDRDRIAFLRLLILESLRFPEIEQLIRSAGAAPARELLAEWLRRQCERGRLRMENCEMAARMLMDMVFGVLTPRFPNDEHMTKADRQRHARMGINIFLDGVRSKSTPL